MLLRGHSAGKMVGWGQGRRCSSKIPQCAPWNIQEESRNLHIGSVNLHSPSWRNLLALGKDCASPGVWLLM